MPYTFNQRPGGVYSHLYLEAGEGGKMETRGKKSGMFLHFSELRNFVLEIL